MRIRIALCALAAVATSLVAAGTASANYTVTPTGPFTGTSNKIDFHFVGQGSFSQTSDIVCTYAKFSGTANSPESGLKPATGLAPPEFKECAIYTSKTGNGPATVTSTRPFTEWQLGGYAEGSHGGKIVGFEVHVTARTSIGSCEANVGNYLTFLVFNGGSGNSLSSFNAFSSLPNPPTSKISPVTSYCEGLFFTSNGVTVSANPFTLNHTLTVNH